MRFGVLVLLFSLALGGCGDSSSKEPPLEPVAAVETAADVAVPEEAGAASELRPYDESADAMTDVAGALSAAAEQNKLVLLTFGANWCTDCRVFEAACQDPQIAEAIAKNFVTAKVDVGNWDKNPEVVEAWGNPIEGGIPAVVVATADKEILFSTKAGQLAKARHMGRAAFIDFFDQLALLGEI